jgi:hypothetical protein
MAFLVPTKDIDYLVSNKLATQIKDLISLLSNRADESTAAASFEYLVNQILANPHCIKINDYSHVLEDLADNEFSTLLEGFSIHAKGNIEKSRIQIFESMLRLNIHCWGIGELAVRRDEVPTPDWFFRQFLSTGDNTNGDGWQDSSMQALAQNRKVPSEILQELWDLHDISNGGSEQLNWAIAGNPNCPPSLLAKLATSHSHIWDDYYYTQCDAIPLKSGQYAEGFVRFRVAENISTTNSVLESILNPNDLITQEECIFEWNNGFSALWAFEINSQIEAVIKSRLK